MKRSKGHASVSFVSLIDLPLTRSGDSLAVAALTLKVLRLAVSGSRWAPVIVHDYNISQADISHHARVPFQNEAYCAPLLCVQVQCRTASRQPRVAGN